MRVRDGRQWCLAALLLPVLPVAAQTGSGYLVIVNAENPIQYLSRDDASSMFLKKTSLWTDGAEVVAVNLGPESPVRAAFSESIHGRSVSNIESYWQQQIFSGRSKPPLVVSDSAAVIQAVRANRGGIGYVAPGTTLDGVRKLGIMVPPERLEFTPPRYTAAAQRAKAQGEVILEVKLDAAGNVTEAVPIKELGFGLTREAMNAVRGWKYRPATLDGEPIATTISVNVVFGP